MSPRFILLVVMVGAVMLIGGLSYWLLQSTLVPQDETSIFMEELREKTGVEFSRIQIVEFKWNIRKNGEIKEIRVQGAGFSAKNVSVDQQAKIEAFFEERGFQKDVYNLAAGTIAGLAGYKKDGFVCLIKKRSRLDRWGRPLATGERDIEIKCGQD